MPDRLAPPKEPPDPATYLVTYPQALELMLDALRKEANPWEAEVVFPGDKRVPLYVCQVDGEMKLSHALHHAQHQREYELKVEAAHRRSRTETPAYLSQIGQCDRKGKRYAQERPRCPREDLHDPLSRHHVPLAPLADNRASTPNDHIHKLKNGGRDDALALLQV